MESEERPLKMRKLAHGGENGDHGVEHALAKGEAEGWDSGTHEDEPSKPMEKDAITSLSSAVDPSNNTGTIQSENGDHQVADSAGNPTTNSQSDPAAPKLSKSQMKKQARLARWEAGREDRKVKRKEKAQERKQRKREAYAELRAKGESTEHLQTRTARRDQPSGTLVPITIIFDCAFDDLMHENELKSLGLQITRCYSDNRKAPYRCHMAVSSFGGKLKERFDGILGKQYTSWKGVHFSEEDFVKVSEMATEWMSGTKGGQVAGALTQAGDAGSEERVVTEATGENRNEASEASHEKQPDGPQAAEEEEEGEVVYLSAESDVTLERLKPNSTYIIGGLVDKNRHKGVCYKRARNRGIKTAKLPIGEFLQMKSRQVLVTNHVLEIMLKWLEFGDWGKAFLEVLPKRKEATLKDEGGSLEGISTQPKILEEEDEDDEDVADVEGGLQDDEVLSMPKKEASISREEVLA